jgi:Fe-S-cluster-containing dehydrogenase component
MAKVFIVDTALCNGCYSCQIGCKDEYCGNDWTPYSLTQPDFGQFWFKLVKHVRGQVPQVKEAYIPLLCMHCDEAPCISACTSSAIYKRDDGLVIIDPTKCTGQRLCIDACPYGVIYFNMDLQISQKCTGCAHILDRGWPITEPRCVDNCYTGMLKFGEESDFSAEITASEPLEPNFGDAPEVRVHYLNIPKRFIAGTVYDPSTKEVIIGATCTLSGAGSATAVTDGFGDFWFEDLDIGTFSLKIEADGKTKTIDDISTENDVGLGDIPIS